MALDKNFTQTVHLNATGDELLRPLNAFSAEINKVIKQLNGLSDTMTSGGHKSEDSLRKQVQLLQRLIGEANTLNTVLNASTGRKRDGLLGELDNAAMGRRVLGASQLKQALSETTKASDALGIRLGQLRIKFNDMALAGQDLRKSDISKALQVEKAIKDVTRLERELSLLDLRANKRGGMQSPNGATMRADLKADYDKLLAYAQNPRIWSKNIEQVQLLIDKVKQLAQAEAAVTREAEKASLATRQTTLQRINQNESQLRATVQRGASDFRFTPDQARGFDMLALGKQIEQNMTRLQRLQVMMSRALNPETSNGEAKLQRLQRYWDQIINKTREAAAQQKAYNDLPENRRAGMFGAMFGTPKAAMSSLATGAVFATFFQTLGAIQSGFVNAVDSALKYEDAMAKLQAIAGATDQQMVGLSASIRDVARDSRFAVEEIAQAASTIAQAGFSSAETGEVLKSALTLAAGSGATPDQAVDTLTSALGAFNLQASESTRIVDMLMSGLNRSKLSIAQMQQAVQYAGATAKENNVQFEELVAISASLANAGLRSGSTIGTGLRQMMVDLKTPTEDFKKELKSLGLTMSDIDVKTLGLAEVVRRLTEAGFSAEQAYSSMEVRAASAFLAFRNQIDGYDELALSLAQQGAAAEANERAMDSLSAKWTKLSNVLKEDAAGALEDTINLLKLTVDGVTSLHDTVANLDNRFTLTFSKTISDALRNYAPLIYTLAKLAGTYYEGGKAADHLQTKANEAGEALQSQEQKVTSADDAIKNLILRKSTLERNEVALQTETLNLTQRFEGLAAELVGTASSYDELLEAMQRYRRQASETSVEKNREVVISQAGIANNAAERAGKVGENARTWLGKSEWRGGIDAETLAKTPQLQEAANFFTKSVPNINLYEISDKDLVGLINRTRALKNNLAELHSENADVNKMLKLLQEELGQFESIRSARGQINLRNTSIAQEREANSDTGQRRYTSLIDLEKSFQEGMAQNRTKPGSGDGTIAGMLREAAFLKSDWQRRLDALKPTDANKAPRANLTADIHRVEGMVRQVEREARIRAEELADGKGPDGTTANLKEVKFRAPLPLGSWKNTSPFSRARKNPVTGKVRPHTGKDMAAAAGTPVLAVADGSVVFAGQQGGYGNIVKIDHGGDVETWYAHLKDGSFAVREGDMVTAGDRIAGVGSTGRSSGNHLHFEVRQKGQAIDPDATKGLFRINPMEAGTAGEKAFEKQQRAVQQLMASEASRKVRTSKTSIDTIMTRARTGSLSPAELSQNLESELGNYERLSMEAWEASRPTDGMSVEELQVRENDRAAEVERIKADVTKFHADLWRWISDSAGKALDTALKAAELEFNESTYQNNAGVRTLESQQRQVQGRANRHRLGAGTDFILQDRMELTELVRDKAQIGSYDTRISAEQMALREFETKSKAAGASGDSELQLSFDQKMIETRTKIRDLMREQADLQTSINERTQKFTEIPILARLEGAARAWGRNSGAMDDWGKVAEDNIGPMLDQLTGGLGNFFNTMATGGSSFGASLKTMLREFAQFVQQMLMQAVALKIVQALMTAIGITGPSVDYDFSGFNNGGVVPGADAVTHKGLYNGGLTSPYPGLYGGGRPRKIRNGGRVNQGTPMRDSSLYELAEGEFVVRNSSVRDLGLGFMNSINDHGSAGLAKMQSAGTALTNIQAPKQETNVYVVADQSAAGMGPNDVLVTIQKDILQNGVTKRLIKQVAQGG